MNSNLNKWTVAALLGYPFVFSATHDSIFAIGVLLMSGWESHLMWFLIAWAGPLLAGGGLLIPAKTGAALTLAGVAIMLALALYIGNLLSLYFFVPCLVSIYLATKLLRAVP